VTRLPYVVYWNNIPAPYMVERFNALADTGRFHFEAWFNDRSEPDRSWRVEEKTWRFPHRMLPRVRVGGRTLRIPTPLLGRRPDLLVSLYAEPVFMLGWALARLRGSKTAFRVLATHDNWVRRSRIRTFAKRLLFSAVDAIETPGADGRRFAIRCGAAPQKIHIATHTVDFAHFAAGADRVRRDGREQLRRQLGLTGTTFLYVGRLWSGKGVDHLINAFERVQSGGSAPVSLLVVGDGPAGPGLARDCRSRGLENVVFAGFKHKEELPGIHAAADVFVFPTLGDPYGLVVDEAMASGLPVVSTQAAGEIRERVREGVNGFLVPPADSVALAERMAALASDATLRDSMGRHSRSLMENRTPQAWASDFERLVRAVLPMHKWHHGCS
jgi:glycosyltransferase involved in cell wall biosynthesis